MGPLFEKPFDPTPSSILNSVLNDDSGSVRCVGSNRNPESGKKSPPPGASLAAPGRCVGDIKHNRMFFYRFVYFS